MTSEEWILCTDADFMLKEFQRITLDLPTRRPLVGASCACARLTLPYLETGEVRPRLALEAAEEWVRDSESVVPDELRAAAFGAADAAAEAVGLVGMTTRENARAAAMAIEADVVGEQAATGSVVYAVAAGVWFATCTIVGDANGSAEGSAAKYARYPLVVAINLASRTSESLRAKMSEDCAAILRTYFLEPPRPKSGVIGSVLRRVLRQ